MEIKGRNKTLIIAEGAVTDLASAIDELAMLKAEMSNPDWSTSVQSMLLNRHNQVQPFVVNYVLSVRKAFLIWANKQASKQKPKVKQVESKVKDGK